MKVTIFPVEPLKLSYFDSTIRVNQFPKGKQTNTTPIVHIFQFHVTYTYTHSSHTMLSSWKLSLLF